MQSQADRGAARACPALDVTVLGSILGGEEAIRTLAKSPELSFFDKVYIVVRMIPKGKVASYGQIAAYLGHPRAGRTVGWALHGIPEGSDVPWQRVINARGRITISGVEYSAALQRELLEEEGIVFGSDDRVDMRVYRWGGPDWSQLDRVLGGGKVTDS